jgi:hypothetical protein
LFSAKTEALGKAFPFWSVIFPVTVLSCAKLKTENSKQTKKEIAFLKLISVLINLFLLLMNDLEE